MIIVKSLKNCEIKISNLVIRLQNMIYTFFYHFDFQQCKKKDNDTSFSKILIYSKYFCTIQKILLKTKIIIY